MTQVNELGVAQKELPAALASPLALDVVQIKGEIVPTVSSEIATPVPDDPIRIKARGVVQTLVSIPTERYDEARRAIDNAGGTAVQAASHQSDMLKGKLGPLMRKSEDGGPIANALIQLRDQVSVLDPDGVNFTPGWLARHSYVAPAGIAVVGGALSIPFPIVGLSLLVGGGGLAGYSYFRGDPLRRYFNRFETGQGAINSVIKSLENGKKTLENDNRVLSDDQKAWRQNTLLLRGQIEYLKAVDAELEAAIAGVADEDHQKFLQEEILFPLRQRVQDLMQRLLVNQQGVLVTEVLIRNNRELIRGVDRALFVTIDALNIAVAAAMALANQKLVLDSVDALNSTTNTLIASTAKRLKTQGAEIQKRASSSMLASDVLVGAFKDINAAVQDVSNYRRNALPTMAQTILTLDQSAQEAEKAISKMERGNQAQIARDLSLDIELPKKAA